MPQTGSPVNSVTAIINRDQLPLVQPPFGSFALEGSALRLSRLAQAQPDTWLGRRLALGLRRLVLGRGVRVIDGELLGLRIRWHPADNVTDRHAFFLPNSWDRAERRFQQDNLPPDGVYLDIGANSGLYSALALKQLDRRGVVVALEPNPLMFRRLLINIALNEPRAGLRLYECGVAERAGQFTLELPSRNLGAASLDGRGRAAASLTVWCFPLLELVRDAGIDRIDFMKIDIEGYEARALAPFFAEAPRALWPRFINIETPRGIDWGGLGYTLVHQTRQNTLFELVPIRKG